MAKKFKPGMPDKKKETLTTTFAGFQELPDAEKDQMLRDRLRLAPYPGDRFVTLPRSSIKTYNCTTRLDKKDRLRDLLRIESLDPLKLAAVSGKDYFVLVGGWRSLRVMRKRGMTEFPCEIIGIAPSASAFLKANLRDSARSEKPVSNIDLAYRILALSKNIHREFGDRVCRHGGKRRGTKDWVREMPLIREDTGLSEDTVEELLRFGKRMGFYALAGLAEYYPKNMGTKKIRRLSTKHKHLGKKIRWELKRREEETGIPLSRTEKVKIAGPIAYDAIHDDDNTQKSKDKDDPPPKPPRKKKIVSAKDLEALQNLHAEILSATKDLGEILSSKAPADEAICEQFDAVVEACGFFDKILSEMRIRKSVGKKGAQ